MGALSHHFINGSFAFISLIPTWCFSQHLFLFPFNTCLLLNKHREVVYSLSLHCDYDRPTIIFYSTFITTTN